MTLVINLTAPEVHPPQQIELSDNGSKADLFGLDETDARASYLGFWDEGRGSVVFETVTVRTALWYLGWAFRDIAEEAYRLLTEFVDAAVNADWNTGEAWRYGRERMEDGNAISLSSFVFHSEFNQVHE